MDMDKSTIKAVRGFNVTERPGTAYLVSFLVTHAQKGLLAFGSKEGSPFKTAYNVMNNWGANHGGNHGAISYGHIGVDLITLCSMLRIPVAMHNVAPDIIFHPLDLLPVLEDNSQRSFRIVERQPVELFARSYYAEEDPTLIDEYQIADENGNTVKP